MSCRWQSSWSQHMLQQYILCRHSNHNIAVSTSNPQLCSLWKNKSATRPGCPVWTYFGKAFVINGKQSVVRDLILWFCTCEIARATQADVHLSSICTAIKTDEQVPVANTTRIVPWIQRHCPWVKRHCPFSSSPQCHRCCNCSCIVPFSLSHFNLKVTDLNSTEQ